MRLDPDEPSLERRLPLQVADPRSTLPTEIIAALGPVSASAAAFHERESRREARSVATG
jgi:hypothetical protein